MGDRLANKVAVITGGTSGIGEATAELFVNEGARVVLSGRTEDKGNALAERLGDNAVFVKADVMSEDDIKNTIDIAVDKFDGLDILFNNAGAGVHGTLTDITGEDVQHAIQLLFTSTALGIKHAIPHLKERGGGSIINNSSIAAIRDNQGSPLYSATKAAVTHYTKLAGTQLGRMNIRVNCISPGAIATPIFWGGNDVQLTDEHYEKRMQKLQNNLAKATPLKVPGLAMDIATAALYLASEDGRFVNSHDLVVDGGRTSMFFEAPED
ncbi:MAG: SDR family NAD(P)-dependent oxidoreductase [Pseudomonadales bacterium]|nr:SDR family NAD(P)-dependent oxidoreductase [Pseudomonadales bacterium]